MGMDVTVANIRRIARFSDEDPETYARNFLTGVATSVGERYGGRPAVAFELFPR